MNRSTLGRICLAALLGLLFAATASAASPARTETAAPGACPACHQDRRLLPAAHVKTDGMDLAACRSCHPKGLPGGKPGDLAGRLPLGHTHQLAGVGCAACHGEKAGVAPATGACTGCHTGFEGAVFRRAKNLPSPHGSHMGELECGLCHRQHRPSENFCGQCHWWKYVVP